MMTPQLSIAKNSEPTVMDWHLPSMPAGIRAQDDDPDTQGEPQADVLVAEPEVAKPPMYAVVMYNDNYTPMEFVVLVLEKFFKKSHDEAVQIMLHVHQKGVGICGVYTFEIAETKVTQVMDLAQKNEHPLQCTLEKE